MIVLLDSGPLGMITNPRASLKSDECNRWLESLLSRDIQVVVPEITDYEVRRELLRANKLEGIKRLDNLKDAIGYIPITTQVMLKAAEFWATARNQSRPAAGDKVLDADMILAAQAVCLESGENEVEIATTNVHHLTLFAKAREWREIQ